MNTMLLNGGTQITADSSFMDRLALGGSTLLLGMAVVFAVLGIIFVALQIMRASFTKKNTRKAKKAEEVAPTAAAKAEEAAPAPVAPVTDEAAIVAAIIAAISAHTGTAPEGFRVVYFKKRK